GGIIRVNGPGQSDELTHFLPVVDGTDVQHRPIFSFLSCIDCLPGIQAADVLARIAFQRDCAKCKNVFQALSLPIDSAAILGDPANFQCTHWNNDKRLVNSTSAND
ncbi:MAG: hypothetical protein PVF86_18740, partial [Desulfobacterales bacterium]